MFPGLVLLALACTCPGVQFVPASKTPAGQHLAVKIITRQEGNTTHFLVENRELCEVTVSFNLGLVHLRPSVPLPRTGCFPPGRVTEAFSLCPDQPGAAWSFSYTDYVKLGSNQAQHDDGCIYELPYGPGEKLEVTQAYGGKFSHTGCNQYAIDWQMPEGTVVHAARGGLVVRTKDDSNRGGGSMDHDQDNNYVLIRHDDGTLGQYCHLQMGGVMVRPGQRVATGQPIAHSGNTGFSTGPHLHFCVLKANSGQETVSLPVKFRTAEAPALTLRSGHAYQSDNLRLASAPAPGASPRSGALQAVGAATP